MKKKNDKSLSKKNESNKVDKIKTSSDVEWKNIFKLSIFVLVFLGFFYLLTLVLVGDLDLFKSKEEEVETVIQYEEILAGSSFTMNANKYLVIYYDKSADDASEIASAIYNYEYSSTDALTVYTVDLSNSLNKNIVTEESSNKNPKDASKLSIKGTTLIRFRDGEVREYIQGKDKVIDYLN